MGASDNIHAGCTLDDCLVQSCDKNRHLDNIKTFYFGTGFVLGIIAGVIIGLFL